MTASSLSLITMRHLLKVRYLIYAVSLIILFSGLFFIVRTLRKAFGGEWEAAVLMLSFTAMIIAATWFIRSYWRAILDDTDIIDSFRAIASEKRAKVESVLRRSECPSGSIKEHGYKFLFKENTVRTEISMVSIEAETDIQHGALENHSFFIIKNYISHPFTALLLNPRFEIRDSPDLTLYAPVLSTNIKRIMHPRVIIVSDRITFWNDSALSNPFVLQDLSLLFMNYRMNYILMESGQIVAVKRASIESIAYDAESFYVLQRLSKLILDQYNLSITKGVSPDE